MAILYRLYTKDNAKEYIMIVNDGEDEQAKEIIDEDELTIGETVYIDKDMYMWPTCALLSQ